MINKGYATTVQLRNIPSSIEAAENIILPNISVIFADACGAHPLAVPRI